MYYIISNEYAGTRDESYWYNVTVETEPGQTNMSHEERVNGWLGTTNNNDRYAHGAYETEAEACTAALALAIELGGAGSIEVDPPEDEPTVIAMYRVGYEQWGAEASCDYCYEGMDADVTADTTDEQIDALIDEHEGFLNTYEGGTLYAKAVHSMITERRNELREENV